MLINEIPRVVCMMNIGSKNWLLFAAVSCASLPVTLLQAGELDKAALQQEAKVAIKKLATTLMQELKAAKQSGGATEAIKVCNLKALPLTEEISLQHGWDISRTSTQWRNPKNKPDVWEQAVLADFQNKADKGADLKKLMHAEVTTNEQGQQVFRVMKAIPVGEKCLACHGSSIKPALLEKLDELYPEDNARGFNAGDLRGAFTLQKIL